MSTGKPQHPPGPPMTLGNMRELSIGLLAVVAFALALATSAEAITPAPLHQPEGLITQIAYSCGADKTRVGCDCVARTTASATPAEPAELSAVVPGGTVAFAPGGTKDAALLRSALDRTKSRDGQVIRSSCRADPIPRRDGNDFTSTARPPACSTAWQKRDSVA
jgi:hypothetical protein